MNKQTLLFCVGVTIQLAALFGDNAADIPFALKTIAPKSYYAGRTAKALESTPSLTISNVIDRGSSEIANILARHTAKKLQWADPSNIKIHNINVNGSEFIDGKLATSIHWSFTLPEPIQYNGAIADRGTDSWSFEVIKEEVDDLRNPNILVFSFCLFLIGTLVDVVAFRIETKKK